MYTNIYTYNNYWNLNEQNKSSQMLTAQKGQVLGKYYTLINAKKLR